MDKVQKPQEKQCEGRSSCEPKTSTPAKEARASSSDPLKLPPTPPLYFVPGDNFRLVMDRYDKLHKRLMTPKKVQHLTYTMWYYNESPGIADSGNTREGDSDSDIDHGERSKLYGITGASEILSPKVIIRKKKIVSRDQGSEVVGEESGAAHVGGGQK